MATIVLSGIQPDAQPLILDEDGTTVVVTAGAVIGRPGGPFAIYGRDVSNTTVQVDGTIVGNTFNTVDLWDRRGSSITVGENGRILNGPTGGAGIEVSYDVTIRNHGEIRSDDGFGVVAISPDPGMVTNAGTIYGAAGGVYFGGGYEIGTLAYLSNSGRIEAGQDASWGGAPLYEAVFSDAAHTQINNSGVILSTEERASGIRVTRDATDLAFGTANIANSGVIESVSQWGVDLSGLNGTGIIVNTGQISGAAGGILASGRDDEVRNGGTIDGDVVLGDGNDVFMGTAGTIAGALRGGAGNDLLVAGRGGDSVFGGDGDDTVQGGAGTDRLDGGAGRDRLLYDTSGTAVHVDLAAGQATFPENPAWGAETVTGFEDVVSGYGDDVVAGTAAGNALFGSSGADELIGRGGNDTLDGSWDADVVRGGAGNDLLHGGGGADVLIGGAGNDVFRFFSGLESNSDGMDRIVAGDGGAAFDGPGAAAGDRIRLSAIDADNGLPGKQTLVFGTGPEQGHVWVEDIGGVSHVRANVDSDAAPELDIAIEDGATMASAYTAADFIL